MFVVNYQLRIESQVRKMLLKAGVSRKLFQLQLCLTDCVQCLVRIFSLRYVKNAEPTEICGIFVCLHAINVACVAMGPILHLQLTYVVLWFGIFSKQIQNKLLTNQYSAGVNPS